MNRHGFTVESGTLMAHIFLFACLFEFQSCHVKNNLNKNDWKQLDQKTNKSVSVLSLLQLQQR